MTPLLQRITVDPRILAGKAIIKGTRIPVDLILKLVSQGVSIEEILDEYPRLTRQDIYAAIAYARDVVGNERVYSLQMHHAT